MNFFQRQHLAYRNELKQGCGVLLGIAEGIMADRVLSDSEVRFLATWLDQHDVIATTSPGDVLHQRVREILADGRVTEEERAHLVRTLQQITGSAAEDTPQTTVDGGPVNQLAFDESVSLAFGGSQFCLTGDFVFGPRPRCESEIAARGGILTRGVTKKLSYLVVGTLGSEEWKHGSFGTKIEKAIAYKRSGVPLSIVREDHWTRALRA